MLIERPPEWFRRFAPDAVFRIPPQERKEDKTVYLTFDDGPIPEVTPRLLDLLDEYGIKATFFMVGDNVRKYPEVYREVVSRGHAIGNHTMHHLVGLKEDTDFYVSDVKEAAGYMQSKLFRPPHGWLKRSQKKILEKDYKIVMYDLVTRDYSKLLSADDVVRNVKRYSRPGSIIVFHDSLKSLPRLFDALPRSLDWLIEQGYKFDIIDYGRR